MVDIYIFIYLFNMYHVHFETHIFNRNGQLIKTKSTNVGLVGDCGDNDICCITILFYKDYLSDVPSTFKETHLINFIIFSKCYSVNTIFIIFYGISLFFFGGMGQRGHIFILSYI